MPARRDTRRPARRSAGKDGPLASINGALEQWAGVLRIVTPAGVLAIVIFVYDIRADLDQRCRDQQTLQRAIVKIERPAASRREVNRVTRTILPQVKC